MASSIAKVLQLLCIIFFSTTCSALHNSSSSSTNTTNFNPNLSSIRSFCKSTPYPDVCFDSLKLSVSINISPNIITYLLQSLQVAISEAGKLSDLFYKAGQYSNIIEKQKGAIQDCKELHQITLSSLQRSVSRVRAGNTKKLNDARAYLSAALTNKNTCLEGLDSASGPMKPALVNSLTSTYNYLKARGSKRRYKPASLGCSNMDVKERSPDPAELWRKYDPSEVLTVAADGTGNFTTITDAVNFAPNNSYDRTIIYVKKGVYVENVEIPSFKTNIVLLGDGSDMTVITGNRSVVDGWTTFRSATATSFPYDDGI
ncbi:putative pectinesterase/pectinesterase inhibitor 12 [Prunus yedoensis var. nudiflora]|uniref:Pectinesterase n=1 Tax=Prunus yedoensis var. nudiflora TaxID=2094558 RepID=A0A314XWT6_PRUYE|nr:putative pectinesterase/pectinesterase inhibitor 12 [Prunus yedoensis var. nudiflora]